MTGYVRGLRRGWPIAAVISVVAALPSTAGALTLPGVVVPVVAPLCPLLQNVAATVAPVPAAGPAVQTAANTVCSLVAEQFTYVTVYDPPGSAPPVRRTHTGFVGVPAHLDVGDSVAADLQATLTILPSGGASLKVSRASGAPAALPVSVEAVVSTPQSASRKVAVGYDALASNAPGGFTGDFNFTDGTTAVAMTTSSPGPSLAVIGELFTPGATDTRVDPTKLRVDVAPVPATAGFDVVDGPHGQSAKYRASAPVAALDATLTETSGTTTVSQGVLNLRNVPTQVDVTQPSADSIEVTANDPIGTADGGFASGGAVQRLDPVSNPAYARIVDDGGVSSKAVRLLGLRHAKVTLGSVMAVAATMQSAPFRALLQDGARTIDGLITNLPETTSLAYSPSAGTFEHQGSTSIGSVAVNAVDPAGLLGRATHVDLVSTASRRLWR